MAKPVFPGFFFFFFLIFQTKTYLFKQKSSAFPFPLLEPQKGHALGTFAPASAQPHVCSPSQLGYGQILPFSLPSTAPCSGHPLLPVFWPCQRFPLPCQQLCSEAWMHPWLFPAASQKSCRPANPIHTPFPGWPRFPWRFVHHLVLLLHLPPLSR